MASSWEDDYKEWFWKQLEESQEPHIDGASQKLEDAVPAFRRWRWSQLYDPNAMLGGA